MTQRRRASRVRITLTVTFVVVATGLDHGDEVLDGQVTGVRQRHPVEIRRVRRWSCLPTRGPPGTSPQTHLLHEKGR